MVEPIGQLPGQPPGDVPEVDFVALKTGQTIGRYEVLSVLGQGGFGITYRARDAQLGREVAIKEYLPTALAIRQNGTTVLPRSTKTAEEFTGGRKRFVDEGRTLASLQRAPAIVRVFDFLEANGTGYIVMELVAGDTLESRLRQKGPLTPDELNRILWPLLDGLEKVHGAGFLHRDIKPANILLSAAGDPTLIDFGAARAAMAGKTAAMTAIFTPGYAAAEQFTSARQGPWTDIYGLAATLYHAITGRTPPSAFDRMLQDAYEPLSNLAPVGFASGLTAGIDAALTVRASERPQSIAAWRSVLRQTGNRAAAVVEPPVTSPAIPVAAKRRTGVWLGIAAAAALALAAGGYYFAVVAPAQVATGAAASIQAAAQAERLKIQEELAKLRAAEAEAEAKFKAEETARQKAEADATTRRKIEEETRRRIEAELAEKQRLEAEAKQKAEAEAAAKRQTEEGDKKAAEAAETALRLTPLDRQRVQVALTAHGFNTNGTDGAFGSHSRDVIAAWQRSKNYAATGFLTGAENQALLKEAASAIAKFDEDQRKAPDATTNPQAAAAGPKGSANAFDGDYSGAANFPNGGLATSVHVVGGRGTGTWAIIRCNSTASYNLSIAPDGAARMELHGLNGQCQPNFYDMSSRVVGNRVEFTMESGRSGTIPIVLTRRGR